MINYDYIMECLPIYKAALEDDWETAKHIFRADTQKLTSYITYRWETPLHIAVGTNRSHRFVERLVEQIVSSGDPYHLWIPSYDQNTPLHYAAKAGNTRAAKLLVSKDEKMTQIVNLNGHTPLKFAAWYAQKDTLCYLLEVTKDVVGEEGTSPFRGKEGADLITLIITAGFYDVALYLVKTYPHLVMEKNNINSRTALQTLAAKPDAFPSGSGFRFWQQFIYSGMPVSREKALESPVGRLKRRGSRNIGYICFGKASYGVIVALWSVLQNLGTITAPYSIKQIHDSKVKYIQAQELVRQMCSIVIKKANHAIAWDVLGSALCTAATHGIHELIEECIHNYPGLVWYNVGGFYLFLAAIKYRQEKVYNLVYQMSGHKASAVTENISGENALHIAAKLAPPHRLNAVTGAALQMQRELQWFKEVEKFVEPTYREALNHDNETPRMVFTHEHKELLKEAQQWMKDTSSSSTVVAAFIVTMAFAAMFEVPGGDNDAGKPLFLTDATFILFAIADAIALFASSTSVLMFLSVLNSRFAEQDFLYALPKRLTIGLISLFISLAATMVAFSATLSLVLRDKIHWIAAPGILLAGISVSLFLLLQYPLLVELFRSTYGRGIFFKQNKLLLH